MYNIKLKSEKDRQAYLKKIESELKSAKNKALDNKEEKDYIKNLESVKDYIKKLESVKVDLSVHPLRFESLFKKLKENPHYKFTKYDMEAIFIALEYSFHFPGLLDEVIKWQWKYIFARNAHTVELNKDDQDSTNSKKHQKANSAALKSLGFVSEKKGKKKSRPPRTDEEIKKHFQEYCDDGLSRLNAVEKIQEKYKFQSVRSTAEYLNGLGLKRVPQGPRNR